MSKYLFVYHGGKNPESEAEVAEVLDAWGAWLGSMGSAVIDGGNPVGMSSTINSDGSVTDNGGANPASGYGLIEASDLDDAIADSHAGVPRLLRGVAIDREHHHLVEVDLGLVAVEVHAAIADPVLGTAGQALRLRAV